MSYKAKAEKCAKELGVTIKKYNGYLQIAYQSHVIYSSGKGYEFIYGRLKSIRNELKKNDKYIKNMIEKMNKPYLKTHKNPSIQLIIDNSKEVGLSVKQSRQYFEFYHENQLIKRIQGIAKAQLFICNYRNYKKRNIGDKNEKDKYSRRLR